MGTVGAVILSCPILCDRGAMRSARLYYKLIFAGVLATLATACGAPPTPSTAPPATAAPPTVLTPTPVSAAVSTSTPAPLPTATPQTQPSPTARPAPAALGPTSEPRQPGPAS